MTSEKNVEASIFQNIPERKRKKHMYKQLRYQMEFYFSDANLQKDRFLNKYLKESQDKYINLDIFLTFNKIRSLTNNIHDLSISIKKSSFLQLDEDKKKVRRIIPYIESTNVDERTVYIEPLPSGTTIELISTHFSNCGKILYISLPRYKTTHDIKGFAFVEFETIEAAQLACQTLNISSNEKIGIFPKSSKKCKELEKQLQKNQVIPNSSASQLIKDKKFKDEKGVNIIRDVTSSVFNKEENMSIIKSNSNMADDIEFIPTTGNKGEKESDVIDNIKLISLTEISNDANKIISKSRKRKISSKSEKEFSATDDVTIKEYPLQGDENFDGEVTKDKRKKLKKTKKLMINSTGVLKEQDLDNAVKKTIKTKTKNKGKFFHDLKVIPKSEWLKLRSEYILKQKNNMNLLKKKLYQLQKESNIDAQPVCIQSNGLVVVEDVIDTTKSTQLDDIKCAKDLTYIPSVVLKFESKQEHSKKDIKVMLNVKYKIAFVDFADGDSFGFVRCLDAETATNLSNDVKYEGLTFHLLSGEEELKYWDKIILERKVKLATKIKKVKTGKEKLKNRADKYLQLMTHKHVLFDDD